MKNICNETYNINDYIKGIAAKEYSEDQLIGLGCKKTATNHYILDSDKLSELLLVFELNNNEKWRITSENRRILFGEENTEPGKFLENLICKLEKKEEIDVLEELRYLRGLF